MQHQHKRRSILVGRDVILVAKRRFSDRNSVGFGADRRRRAQRDAYPIVIGFNDEPGADHSDACPIVTRFNDGHVAARHDAVATDNQCRP